MIKRVGKKIASLKANFYNCEMSNEKFEISIAETARIELFGFFRSKLFFGHLIQLMPKDKSTHEHVKALFKFSLIRTNQVEEERHFHEKSHEICELIIYEDFFKLNDFLNENKMMAYFFEHGNFIIFIDKLIFSMVIDDSQVTKIRDWSHNVVAPLFSFYMCESFGISFKRDLMLNNKHFNCGSSLNDSFSFMFIENIKIAEFLKIFESIITCHFKSLEPYEKEFVILAFTVDSSVDLTFETMPFSKFIDNFLSYMAIEKIAFGCSHEMVLKSYSIRFFRIKRRFNSLEFFKKLGSFSQSFLHQTIYN